MNSDRVKHLDRLYLDGFVDDTVGDVYGFGWYGLFIEELGILSVDSQGFKAVDNFDTKEELLAMWDVLNEDYTRWLTAEENCQ